MKYIAYIQVHVAIESDLTPLELQAQLARAVTVDPGTTGQVTTSSIAVSEQAPPFPGIAGGTMEKLGEMIIKKLGEGDEPWRPELDG